MAGDFPPKQFTQLISAVELLCIILYHYLCPVLSYVAVQYTQPHLRIYVPI